MHLMYKPVEGKDLEVMAIKCVYSSCKPYFQPHGMILCNVGNNVAFVKKVNFSYL